MSVNDHCHPQTCHGADGQVPCLWQPCSLVRWQTACRLWEWTFPFRFPSPTAHLFSCFISRLFPILPFLFLPSPVLLCCFSVSPRAITYTATTSIFLISGFLLGPVPSLVPSLFLLLPLFPSPRRSCVVWTTCGLPSFYIISSGSWQLNNTMCFSSLSIRRSVFPIYFPQQMSFHLGFSFRGSIVVWVHKPGLHISPSIICLYMVPLCCSYIYCGGIRFYPANHPEHRKGSGTNRSGGYSGSHINIYVRFQPRTCTPCI